MSGALITSLGIFSACEPSIAPGKAAPGEVGAPCTTETDCLSGSATCLSMGTDGYCSSDCSSLGQLGCAAGSICQQLSDQAVLCMDGCCSSDDCRDGFRCERKPELDIYVDVAICPEPGICLLSCTSDASCPQGQVCDVANGNCVPRVGVNSGVGAPCDADGECNSGSCLSTYPGGYCTSGCGTQFTACEPGSECYTWGEATPTCMSRCEADAQCRPGYRCEISAEQQDGTSVRGFCVPRCDAFGRCPDGQSCDPATGSCQDGSPTAGPIGAFCVAAGNCLSGMCETTWPNGSCTASCTAGTACPDGSVCDDGRCLSACATANDCRFGYVCLDGGCQPGCKADVDCDGEQVCDTASGFCVSPSVPGTLTEFANQTLQITSTGSNEITFTVPPNAISAVIHVDDGDTQPMSVLKLIGPSNTTIFDIQDPANSRVRFLPTAGTFTGMFPNSPNVNLVPGEYRATFARAQGSANAQIRVFGKTAAGFPARQTLALSYYFIGAPQGMNAATAPGDARFQQAHNEMVAIYASMGVDVTGPTYEDIQNAAALRTVDTVEGATSELSQLFRLGNKPDTLQFYFVEEILGGQEGFVILGVAGGIPGPPGIAGGPHSGVAVTLSGAINDPPVLGQVMAHEGAHFMGLFHTSEATGTAHDPLPDTVQCSASRDSNWDGYVSSEECRSSGSDNFMFWAASGTARGTSAEQGKVLRRNPITK